MPYKVLLPLDGSPLSERSLAYLPALKPVSDLQLQLFSVLSDSQAESSPEADARSAYLNKVADSARQEGFSVSAKIGAGQTADAILQEATDGGFDLIMISTHGRSGLQRWRWGSVADKLIRASECNTLVIGPHDDELAAGRTPKFNSVLVPLDGSPLAEQALPLAGWFAENLGAAIHLVQVVPVPFESEGFDSHASPGGTSEAPMIARARELISGMESDAQSYLQRAASGLPIATQLEVLTGDAAAEIDAYATAKDIDLIVMTSHGHSGIARAALGSVTDRLIGGPAPVLVVRGKAVDV